MAPHFKYILFDFDGTIADSRALFLTLYNALAAKHGYTPMTQDNIIPLRGMSIPQRCRYLKVPLYRIPFLAAAVIRKYKASVITLTFSPGMKELLAALMEKDIPFAVLSSNSKENIALFFGHHGLEVREIYGSRSIFGKHVLINKFLRAKGLAASDVLYVGDELRDIQACRKSGIKVAWVSWGYDSPDAIKDNTPDYIAHSPEELQAIVC